jgi:hypothetical protein
MQIYINNQIYDLEFYHNQTIDLDFGTKNRSTCVVAYGGKDSLPHISTAFCNPSDRFVKKLGRKIAFKKLLMELDATREERIPSWETYKQKFAKDGWR